MINTFNDYISASMRMHDFGVSSNTRSSKINYTLLLTGVVVGFVCYMGIV